MLISLRKPLHCSVFLVALLAMLQASAQAPAPTPAPSTGKEVIESGENVTLNFNGADIDTVIRAIGKITGRNFLIDPRVKGTINIVTSRPVSRSMVYQILLSALRLQGYATIEDGKVTKVLLESDAKLHATPIVNPQNANSGERIATEVFHIKHESAAQLVQVVRPLVAPNNSVTAYPSNNTLVVTDYADNLTRIRRILESIDQPPADSQIIPIQNASAVDLAALLTKLFNESGNTEPSQKVSILADPRSNSLIVRSDNRSRVQAVRSMTAQLDQNGSLGRMRVVYLKNGDATKIAQTLRAIVTGEAGGGAAGANAASPAAQANPQGGLQQAALNRSGSAANVVANLGGAYIYADAATNSIVINASDATYNSLRGAIEQLDRRPAQVYVEALIAEISADRASEFGIQWNSAAPNSGKTTVFGGTNFNTGGKNILNVSANPASIASANGLNIAIGSGPVTILGQEILNIAGLARFLESDTKTNILSTPSLVTVDGEEARIVVGSNVPFITGTFTNTGANGATNPFQTIERKDVGLTLKIKPQITEGGSVRLNVSQETSSVIATSPTLGPTTSKRSLDSVVIVDNGDFLALGGLVEDSTSGNVDKIPVLGDIPIIGALFRYDTRARRKTNLVIFLRPVILRSPEDSNKLTNSRYDHVLGTQKTSIEGSLLPALPKEVELPIKPIENGQSSVQPGPSKTPQ